MPHAMPETMPLRAGDLIVTDADLARLQAVLEQNDTPASEALDTELRRATIVPQRDVPPDVVTMNSQVVYEDVATGARREIHVVFPKDADVRTHRVSVLAPIGAALLGLRVGQEIEWPVPHGVKRIRVAAVSYQPESAGNLAR